MPVVIEVDCTTGETTERELTADELAERAQLAAEGDIAAIERERDNTNDGLLRARLGLALDDLRPIANSSGSLTGAQLSAAVRVMARVLIGLVRYVLRQLDGLD